jgi:hypothetical protein
MRSPLDPGTGGWIVNKPARLIWALPVGREIFVAGVSGQPGITNLERRLPGAEDGCQPVSLAVAIIA